MNIFKLLYERFSSSTPKFWNRVTAFGVVLTTVSAGLLAAPDNINIPGWLENAAGYLATAGFVISLFAQATTKDQELSEK